MLALLFIRSTESARLINGFGCNQLQRNMAELSKGEGKHRHPEIIDEAYEDKKKPGSEWLWVEFQYEQLNVFFLSMVVSDTRIGSAAYSVIIQKVMYRDHMAPG